MDISPLAKYRRHPADYRDELEHAEVAQVLSELPGDYAVRVAYACGAREAAKTVVFTSLSLSASAGQSSGRKEPAG